MDISPSERHTASFDLSETLRLGTHSLIGPISGRWDFRDRGQVTGNTDRWGDLENGPLVKESDGIKRLAEMCPGGPGTVPLRFLRIWIFQILPQENVHC